MRKRAIFWVGALSLIVLVFFLARQIWVPKRTVEESADSLAFFPSTVQALKWKVGTQEFDYFRSKKNPSQWSPQTAPDNIEARLLAMATSWGKAYSGSLEPLVEVQLTFLDGSEWAGHWDGKTFQWTSGPKAGEGAKLSPEHAALFRAGRFAFENRKYLLCLDRVDGFKWNRNGNLDIEVRRASGQWTATKKGKTANLDPSYYEPWLARNCEITAEHNIDPELWKERPKADSALEIRMNQDKALTLDVAGTDFVQLADRMFVANLWSSRWAEFLDHAEQALAKAK